MEVDLAIKAKMSTITTTNIDYDKMAWERGPC